MNDLISQYLDIWTSAIASRSTAGRGNKSPSPAGEGWGEGNPTNTRNAKYTAYGIKKLRELILELAVRGKLVPQDPNDEPANDLLNQINDLKNKLVRAGEVKTQKPLDEISFDEMTFDLPHGWIWCRLGEICEFVNGYAFKSSDFSDQGIGIVKIGDIQNGEITTESMSRVNKSVVDGLGDAFVVKNGEMVIAMSGATTGKLGFNYTDEAFYLNQRVGKISPFICYSRFLYYPLTTKIQENLAKSMGSAIPNLSTAQIKDIVLALPPLAEQHRIVAKVDDLMALCDQLEQQQTDHLAAHQTLVQTLLDTLTQAADAAEFERAWNRIADHFDNLFTAETSIDQLKQTLLQLAVMGKLVPQNHNGESARLFLENIFKEKKKLVDRGIIRTQKAFSQIEAAEKPQNIPVSWELSRLGEFTIVGTGSTPSRDKASYYFPPEVNWVTSGETSQNFIFETNENISKIALKETNVSVYPIGTLIIAMYGQGKTRGQVSELMIEAGTNQACAAVVCVNKEVAHRRFIKLFFMKAYEELRSHSAGGAQPNLNLAKISNTVIPIPPLEEQHRIVAKVDELMALCDALKARIAAAQTTQLQIADAIVEQAVA